MKVIGQYKSRTDAEVAKGFLESAGIHANISSDDEGGMLPALGVQNGARLLVADEAEQQAKEILAQVDAAAKNDKS